MALQLPSQMPYNYEIPLQRTETFQASMVHQPPSQVPNNYGMVPEPSFRAPTNYTSTPQPPSQGPQINGIPLTIGKTYASLLLDALTPPPGAPRDIATFWSLITAPEYLDPARISESDLDLILSIVAEDFRVKRDRLKILDPLRWPD
ncbi:hypothetical protein DOTSEDRAFT_24408 [Dothistroma septosporum NZE10]|uniref:Uncharacterized protein n=1 Tax=Dothistroma septosporum (strain NZE10 / CBS 128990) TaxID=675120 RepID=N1PPP6_DOTSN|nr:hypothetical protein DOTSEDRAFT_24408 [Dothistroma septosporum NZE10]